MVGLLLLGVTLLLAANDSMSLNSNARCSSELSSAPSEISKEDNNGQLRIIDVWPKPKPDKPEVQLGSRICVAVAGVAASTAARGSTVDVTLFLNDQRSPLTAKANPIPDRQFLTFDLVQPSDASSDAATFWRRIVGGKAKKGKVALTVGLSRGSSTTPEVWAASASELAFVVYRPLILGFGAAALFCLIVAFIFFAANTSILRDDNSVTAGVPNGTFSLGKTQMALWLVLVTAGFIFLWLTLGLYLHLITTGILVLLGINGATGLAAVAIDKVTAGQGAQNANAPQTTTAFPQTNAASQPGALRRFFAGIKRFFTDITSDADGPQLHRIQVLAWTLILGTIFVWNVVWNFVFVDFDTNLLLLMGIANAMYLGFKPKEK